MNDNAVAFPLTPSSFSGRRPVTDTADDGRHHSVDHAQEEIRRIAVRLIFSEGGGGGRGGGLDSVSDFWSLFFTLCPRPVFASKIATVTHLLPPEKVELHALRLPIRPPPPNPTRPSPSPPTPRRHPQCQARFFFSRSRPLPSHHVSKDSGHIGIMPRLSPLHTHTNPTPSWQGMGCEMLSITKFLPRRFTLTGAPQVLVLRYSPPCRGHSSDPTGAAPGNPHPPSPTPASPATPPRAAVSPVLNNGVLGL